MQTLFGDSSGVMRKTKKSPFTDLSGVQRNTKTGWLCRPEDGVTRKIFISNAKMVVPPTWYGSIGEGNMLFDYSVSSSGLFFHSGVKNRPGIGEIHGTFYGAGFGVGIGESMTAVNGQPIFRVNEPLTFNRIDLPHYDHRYFPSHFSIISSYSVSTGTDGNIIYPVTCYAYGDYSYDTLFISIYGNMVNYDFDDNEDAITEFNVTIPNGALTLISGGEEYPIFFTD